MSDRPNPPSNSEIEFDFDYRPDYWSPENPKALILGNVTGEMRRVFLERLIEGDSTVELLIDEDAREDHLTPEGRVAQGRFHPSGFGGEFLPEYLPGELEIARIVLESVTMDVVSVRARRTDGKILFRAVWEYPEYGQILLDPTVSEEPLDFREMIDLMHSVHHFDGENHEGSFIDASREANVNAGASLERMRYFVAVKSFFYPKLEAYFDLKAQEWYERKLLERMERCPDCGKMFDPYAEDHECPEMEARMIREAEERKVREREMDLRIAPFRGKIERVVERWRRVDPGGPGAGGMVAAAARARAHFLERFLREYVAAKAMMPTGSHTIEWQFLDDKVRTFTADFDALARCSSGDTR